MDDFDFTFDDTNVNKQFDVLGGKNPVALTNALII